MHASIHGAGHNNNDSNIILLQYCNTACVASHTCNQSLRTRAGSPYKLHISYFSADISKNQQSRRVGQLLGAVAVYHACLLAVWS